MRNRGNPCRCQAFACWLAQHPFADNLDQAGFLGQRNEIRRRNHAALGMTPAQQRLNADDAALAQIHLGLIMQIQFLAL